MRRYVAVAIAVLIVLAFALIKEALVPNIDAVATGETHCSVIGLGKYQVVACYSISERNVKVAPYKKGSR